MFAGDLLHGFCGFRHPVEQERHASQQLGDDAEPVDHRATVLWENVAPDSTEREELERNGRVLQSTNAPCIVEI